MIPRVDAIKEDHTGEIWVFCLGKERRIFKFSPELTLLEHYKIDSPREISAFGWADPAAINQARDLIFYPAGMGKVGTIDVRDTGSKDGPKFGYCFDSASKFLFAHDHISNRKIAKHTIFSLTLTNNEKYLVADQGTRSIRIINVDVGTSYEERKKLPP